MCVFSSAGIAAFEHLIETIGFVLFDLRRKKGSSLMSNFNLHLVYKN
jgi:hypothetical protein